MRPSLWLLASMLVIGGCGGSSESPSGASYSDASSLAAALGCESSFAVAAPDDHVIRIGAAQPVSAGSCTFDGAPVSIQVFESEEDTADVLREGRLLACDLFRSAGLESFAYAAGPNWTVNPVDPTDGGAAAAAARAAEGEAETVDCG